MDARKVNELLRPTFVSKRVNGDIYTLRLLFTRYPKQTLSVVVFENRQKLVEIPIENLDEFVNAINSAYYYLKIHGSEETSEEQSDNRESREAQRRTQTSRSKRSTRRSSRRRLRRD